MYYLFVVALIVLGILSASVFVEKKIPQVKIGLDLIKPFSGWIGLVSMVMGCYWLIRSLMYLGTMLKWAPVNTIIYIASVLLLIVLGFLLAKTLIKQFSGKNEKVDGVLNKMGDKFEPLKEKLGLAAIGTGLLNLLLHLT